MAQPYTASGPRYDIVAEVSEDPTVGRYLNGGSVLLGLHGRLSSDRTLGSVLQLESEVSAGPPHFNEPPDPLALGWRVRQILIRQWECIPDEHPNSWLPDPTTVRFQAIEKMRMWEDVRSMSGERAMTDYLAEIEPDRR